MLQVAAKGFDVVHWHQHPSYLPHPVKAPPKDSSTTSRRCCGSFTTSRWQRLLGAYLGCNNQGVHNGLFTSTKNADAWESVVLIHTYKGNTFTCIYIYIYTYLSTVWALQFSHIKYTIATSDWSCNMPRHQPCHCLPPSRHPSRTPWQWFSSHSHIGRPWSPFLFGMQPNTSMPVSASVEHIPNEAEAPLTPLRGSLQMACGTKRAEAVGLILPWPEGVSYCSPQGRLHPRLTWWGGQSGPGHSWSCQDGVDARLLPQQPAQELAEVSLHLLLPNEMLPAFGS